MFGNRTKSYSLKIFENSITELIIMKASSVSLHPRRFLPRLSGEHIVFTEIYEGRNATGMISLCWVVIKNKQMEYIEQNRTKSKDQVRLGSVYRTH